jgi:hypothetical protein
MDKRLKELAIQAGVDLDFFYHNLLRLSDFAELVRQDEREACAKLLDDFSNTSMVPAKDTWRYGVMMAANCVRDKK